MLYYFDADVACEVGVNAAIILQNIAYWVKKNEANEVHFHDGCYWTYNSFKAFQRLYPFWTERVIRYTLDKLEKDGYLLVGQYHKDKMNHTRWYTLTAKGWNLLPKKPEPKEAPDKTASIDVTKSSHRCDKNDFPTNYTNNNYTDSKQQLPRAREEELGEVLTTFSNNIHPVAGEIELDKLTDLFQTYGKKWMLAAITEAVTSNGRSVKYISAILERWQRDGFQAERRRDHGRAGEHPARTSGHLGTSEKARRRAEELAKFRAEYNAKIERERRAREESARKAGDAGCHGADSGNVRPPTGGAGAECGDDCFLGAEAGPVQGVPW